MKKLALHWTCIIIDYWFRSLIQYMMGMLILWLDWTWSRLPTANRLHADPTADVCGAYWGVQTEADTCSCRTFNSIWKAAMSCCIESRGMYGKFIKLLVSYSYAEVYATRQFWIKFWKVSVYLKFNPTNYRKRIND